LALDNIELVEVKLLSRGFQELDQRISSETAAGGCPKCEPYEVGLVKDKFNL
jgi:hypothetical protein